MSGESPTSVKPVSCSLLRCRLPFLRGPIRQVILGLIVGMVRGQPLVEPGNGRGRCDPTAWGFHRFQVDSFSFRTNHTSQDVTSRSADMRRNWFPSFSMGSLPVVLEFRIVPGWYKQVLFTRSSQLYPLAGFNLRQQFGGRNLVFQVCGVAHEECPSAVVFQFAQRQCRCEINESGTTKLGEKRRNLGKNDETCISSVGFGPD